jgi:serine/threonine-protein kinase RsbW
MRGNNTNCILSPQGDITWQSASRLRDRLNLLIEQGYHNILVNFSDVSYVDSAGLATLLSANRKLKARSGTLMLVNVPDRIMRALRQARLSEIIPMRGERSASRKIMSEPISCPIFMRTLSVPCEPERMGETRNIVTNIIESFDLPSDEVFDLTLAFGEALGNAFDHGGAPSDAANQQTSSGAASPGSFSDDIAKTSGGAGNVTVSVSRFSDRIVIEVTDCGCGMKYEDGDKLPEPSEMRGRGIRLMTMLVDSVSIEPKPSGRGTIVRLVKLTDACNAQREA